MPQTETTTPPEAAPDRKIIALSGTDARKFLQGMITNDVSGDADALVYAALLSPQGKYLADFFVVPAGDDIWLDVDADQADGLLKRLTMFKLRADVTLELTDIPVAMGLGPVPEGAYADPRHAALGWRMYGVDGGPQTTDWAALRVAHAVPQAGVELIPNDSFILEMGFERLHGVDFKKGCYVGQEVTARMKHKTELRKGLVRVSVQGSAPAGTEIINNGKPAGTLFTQAGDAALAFLRFDRAEGELTAGAATLSRLPDPD
ncbi:YgfZ/GcvT domain-containing protein [Tropicimonas sp. S265A]|uniref:CAF17-like 4Fe-4S cluster assembly/insertion protein YgfZ n=1 Tax=Tropicimonas sp. S265A TaxID=3415134 RepID=UPI003C7A6936